MAEGDLITRDYQYEFRGLLFGSGTWLIVERVEGLLSIPSPKRLDLERQDSHGEYPGRMLLEPRNIEVSGVITGMPGEEIEDRIRQAQSSFLPVGDHARLVYRRPGTGVRFAECRVHKRDIASEYDTARGKADLDVLLKAVDPRLYSLPMNMASATISSGNTSSSVTITNEGDYRESPVIHIEGPANNPRVKHNDLDRTIRIDINIPNGQTLVIDTKRRTVMIGETDHYDKVRKDNQWWALEPGPNSITYSRSSSTGSSTMEVYYHHAWV